MNGSFKSGADQSGLELNESNIFAIFFLSKGEEKEEKILLKLSY